MQAASAEQPSSEPVPYTHLTLVLEVSGTILKIGMSAGIWEPYPSWIYGFKFERLVQVTAQGQGSLADAAIAPLSILFMLNLLLFFFNLLPLPPLDGSAVLPAFMSNETAARYNSFLHQPMISLLGLLLAWRVFPQVFNPILIFVLRILYG